MEFLGVLSKFPDIREKEEKWTVQAQQIILGGKKKETSGKVLVQLPRDSDAEYGDTLRFTGTLEIPFESEEFSYKKYLSREGVFSIMSFPKFEKIGEKHHLLFSPLYQVRVWFDSELKKRIPSPESAFAAGILIGDRSGFSDEWEERFRITGLSHLLALSGYNVTIIALAVFFVTIWLPKNLRIATTVLFLATFVVFVGGGSSIIRAAIMGGIGLFIVHSGRTTHGLYLLLIACVIMAILHPLILVYDPSFQLSAAGVLGLLAFSEPIGRAAERFLQNRFFREILVATLAAQIGVLPLISVFIRRSVCYLAYCECGSGSHYPNRHALFVFGGDGGNFLSPSCRNPRVCGVEYSARGDVDNREIVTDTGSERVVADWRSGTYGAFFGDYNLLFLGDEKKISKK
jgi:competence protein ComEC